MADNPLRYAMDYGAPDNPLAAGTPTWADAASWHAQNLQATLAAIRDPKTWIDAAHQYGNALLMGSIAPGRLAGSVPSEPGFVYHATNAERLQDIANSGKLNTHRPGDFTDQSTWPDGSTQRRNYFTPTAENTWQFAPEDGPGALIRLRRDAHPIQAERSTGDLYSTKPVPAKAMEYLGDDGAWHPVTDLKGDISQ